MRKRVSKILAAADARGNIEAVQQFAEEAANVGADAIVLLGSLTDNNAKVREYGRVLRALSTPGLPTFYIPGREDAPFAEFLHQAANIEVVCPNLHGVHGRFAFAPGYLLFAGMGGAIEDEANTLRDETETLRYPGWEVEYRLKFLRELKDYQQVFLFATPPEHKGHHQKGSSVVAELIKTYKPRVALSGGRAPSQELLGTSLLVTVGGLEHGDFTLVDLGKHAATAATLGQTLKVA